MHFNRIDLLFISIGNTSQNKQNHKIGIEQFPEMRSETYHVIKMLIYYNDIRVYLADMIEVY